MSVCLMFDMGMVGAMMYSMMMLCNDCCCLHLSY